MLRRRRHHRGHSTLFSGIVAKGFVAFGLALALVACGDDDRQPFDSGVTDSALPDGGVPDGGFPDGGIPDGGFPDGGLDAGPDVPRRDAGPLPVDSEPSLPAVVESTGTDLVLRGTILTPDGPLEGELRAEAGIITCVDRTCPHEGATVIDTQGVVSPGLVDAHNHLAYNFIPEWEPDPLMIYNNRYEWSDVDSYEAHIAPYGDRRATSVVGCPASLWGELRAMIHGTTTVQGQSFNRTCIGGGVRNAEHRHRLGYNHMRTSIGSVRDINDDAAQGYVDSFIEADEPATRFAVHMQEGLMGDNIELEFESFAGRDTRTNRHAGLSLLSGDGYFGVALLIHSMALTTAQLMESIDGGAHFVWSPSSNLVLYGDTAPIEEMLSLAIDVALAPDWTVSGADDMLSEMRFAYGYGLGESISMLDEEMIWRMSTENAADAVGLADRIGTLEVGRRADITVFGRRAMNPYRAVLDSGAEDVRLVLIDGQSYYGDLGLEDSTSVNGSCEVFDACGTAKFLCVAELPGSSGDWVSSGLEDIRGDLQEIIRGYADADPPLTYTEPLPLVQCR